ncbi:MAG TPA: hypothetical protein VGI40_03710 [Pirellulaceae bacterium]|jgi:hypothetical protein
MLRFTIRDWLWLTVVVALLLVMWRDRAVLQKEHQAVQAKKREVDARFLRMVKLTDELLERHMSLTRPAPTNNQMQAEPGIYFLGPEVVNSTELQ